MEAQTCQAAVTMSGATDAQCNQVLEGIQSDGFCGGRDGSSSSTSCPTKAQSITFSATGSCGEGTTGNVTISTQPGHCSLVVKGAEAVGLPSQGQFSTAATQTDYDIEKGNWQLSLNRGDAGEGSEDVACDVTATSAKILLSCSSTICPPVSCQPGGCSNTSCSEQLTPIQ
jgi:hypothetical protein